MQSISALVNDKSFVKKVQLVLISLFVLIVALDIYLALDKTDDNTISNIIQSKTDNGLFVLTYFWGVIAANLFFVTYNKPQFSGTIGSIIVILIAVLIVIFDIGKHVDSYFIKHQYNISIYSLSMLFGLGIGLLFWRQQQ